MARAARDVGRMAGGAAFSAGRATGQAAGSAGRGAGRLVVAVQNHLQTSRGELAAIQGIPVIGGLLAGIMYPFYLLFRIPLRTLEKALGIAGNAIGVSLRVVLEVPMRIIAIILSLLVVGYMFYWMAIGLSFLVPGSYVWLAQHGISAIKDIPNALTKGVNEKIKGISQAWDMQIKRATGQYWQGEEEGEEVGVFLDRVMPAQALFYPGEDIVVYADIHGRGDFGEDNEVVKADCLIIDEDWPADVVQPPQGIPLWTLSNSPDGFECVWRDGYDVIDEPSKQFQVTVKFPFTTDGRLTLTFMDEEAIRQLRREEKLPSEVYGIPERPVSTFKSGPISIGLGTVRSNPIGVQRNAELLTRLGLTLENRWQGEIVNVTSVTITLDPGLSMVQGDNTILFTSAPAANGRTAYTIGRTELRRLTDSGRKPITTFQSLNLRMRVKSTILGNGVFTPKEIGVNVVYDYALWQKGTILLDYQFDSLEGTVPGTVYCGSSQCAAGQRCCLCIAGSECGSLDYVCLAACDGVRYRDIPGGTPAPPPAPTIGCGATTCTSGMTCCRCIVPSSCASERRCMSQCTLPNWGVA